MAWYNHIDMNNKVRPVFWILLCLSIMLLPIALIEGSLSEMSNKIQAFMAYFTLLAVLVALFGEKLWEILTQPILQIDFELAPPGCHKTQMKGPQISFPVYYFRFLVKNYGKRQAEECEMVLEKIFEEKNGRFEQYKNYTPVTLKWSGSRNPHVRDLQPNRGIYCDLGRVHSPTHKHRSIYVNITEDQQKESKFVLELPVSELYYSQWDSLLPGRYLLDIVVYSKNAKVAKRRFELTWSGIWKEDNTEMLKELIIK